MGVTAVAAWSWLRPYEWRPDPAARCRVVETLVTRDRTFFWVDVHLKMRRGQHLDLQKSVRLLSGDATHESADTTFAGNAAGETDEMWYKFWLDGKAMQAPLDLQINGGVLHVKTTHGVPDLNAGEFRNHTNNRW